MNRTGSLARKTGETDIFVSLDLDGEGVSQIDTGIGFFDHMLSAVAKHGLMDLTVRVQGDLAVDGHHTVEDTGIVLGRALSEALGDKRGIRRFGSALVPLDEALVLCAVDVSGRGGLYWDVRIGPDKVGAFDTELAHEFFVALAREAGITLHLRLVCGENAHHIIEAAFKACARALREAFEADPRVDGVPSTKGSL